MSNKTMVDTYKELELEEYDEWKTGAGKNTVKPGGTSYDETTNRANYNQYVTEVQAQNALNRQKNQLEANKQSALSSNNQNRENTMRDISVVQERAKEYVERRAKLNGTATAGVSQTSMVDLYSQMAGKRAEAQASYDNQEQSILQSYRDAISSAENNYDSTVSSSRQNTNNIIANNEIERLKVEEQKAEQAAKEAIQKAEDMAAAKTALNNLTLTYTSYTELEVAINTYKDLYGEENLPEGILDKLEAAKAGTKSQYVTEQEAAQAAKDAIQKAEDMAAAKTALNNLALTYSSYTELEVAINTYKDLYGEENLPEGILETLAAAKAGTKSQYTQESLADEIENAKAALTNLGLTYSSATELEAAINLFKAEFGENNLPEGILDTLAAAQNGTLSQAEQEEMDELDKMEAEAKEAEIALAKARLTNVGLTYSSATELEAAINEFKALYGEENLPEGILEKLEAAKAGTSSQLSAEEQAAQDAIKDEAQQEEIKCAKAVLSNLGRSYTSPTELENAIEEFKALYGEENLPDGILDKLAAAKEGVLSDAMQYEQDQIEAEEAELKEEEMKLAGIMLSNLGRSYENYIELENAIEEFKALYGEENLPAGILDTLAAAKEGTLSEWSQHEEDQREAEEAEAREEEIKYAQIVLSNLGRTYENHIELENAIEEFKTLYGEENLPAGIMFTLQAAKLGTISEWETLEKAETERLQAMQAHITALNNDILRFSSGYITLDELEESYEKHGAELDPELYADLHNEYDKVIQSVSNSYLKSFKLSLEAYEAGEMSFDELQKSHDECKKFVDSDAYNSSEDIDSYNHYLLDEKLSKGFVGRNNYGVTADSLAFNVSRVTEADISNELDVSGGNKQTEYVEKIVSMLRNGEFKNFTVINMNYGAQGGDNKGNYFVYYRGKLYQTTLTRDDIEAEGIEDYDSVSLNIEW